LKSGCRRAPGAQSPGSPEIEACRSLRIGAFFCAGGEEFFSYGWWASKLK
jgi:hypothetical protein